MNSTIINLKEFIKLIQQRRALWDSSFEEHTDNDKKLERWTEVFTRVDINYVKMSEEEKGAAGK